MKVIDKHAEQLPLINFFVLMSEIIANSKEQTLNGQSKGQKSIVFGEASCTKSMQSLYDIVGCPDNCFLSNMSIGFNNFLIGQSFLTFFLGIDNTNYKSYKLFINWNLFFSMLPLNIEFLLEIF